MNTLIVYESMFGNTRMLAEAIAETLRSADVGAAVTTGDPRHLSKEFLRAHA